MDFVECVGAPGICDRVDSCVTREIWKQMSEKVIETLNGITLQDMVDRQGQKLERQALAYSI